MPRTTLIQNMRNIGIAAHIDAARTDIRLLHAVGDGTFTADGERFDRRAAMRAKLPDGL